MGTGLSIPGAPFDSFTDQYTVAVPGQTIFTLSRTFAGPFSEVLVNSASYTISTDYTIGGTTMTWLDTDFALEVGDRVIVVYQI